MLLPGEDLFLPGVGSQPTPAAAEARIDMPEPGPPPLSRAPPPPPLPLSLLSPQDILGVFEGSQERAIAGALAQQPTSNI